MEQLSPGQIKKLLRQLKQRQEQYLYYLGQLAYQAGEQEKLTEPEMLEAFNTLKDIQGQIAQAETSLEQIKAAKEAAQNPRCPNCGGATAKNAPFCPNCGSSLAAPTAAPVASAPSAAPVAPAPTGKACANCGAPLDEDAVFCGNCGAKTEAPAAPVATPEPPAAPAAAEAASPETADAAGAEGEPATTEEDVPELEETLACPGCGTDILEKDVRFCPSCGTKVRE
jgi:RNA polymerase subunit RPABC4/transcription elongation factor Spt4